MSIGHHQWSGNIPHEGPLEECEWCNPKLRKREVETMSDDIVARLRDLAKWEDGLTGPSDTDLIREAAAAIERKDAEIAELRADCARIADECRAEAFRQPCGGLTDDWIEGFQAGCEIVSATIRRALNPEE